MLSAVRARLTYANVMATAAVFIALGGSSYAALKVTGKNVKNSSLTGADVKNSSLTTSDVKNRSLLSKDFKSGQLPAGPTGPQGPQGRAGADAVSAFAAVTADGHLAFGRGATNAFKGAGTGDYGVTFARSAAGCAIIATQGFGNPAGAGDTNSAGASASVDSFGTQQVTVNVADADGNALDQSFFVALLC